MSKFPNNEAKEENKSKRTHFPFLHPFWRSKVRMTLFDDIFSSFELDENESSCSTAVLK